jgi:hypothetical protein
MGRKKKTNALTVFRETPHSIQTPWLPSLVYMIDQQLKNRISTLTFPLFKSELSLSTGHEERVSKILKLCNDSFSAIEHIFS